MMFQIIRQLNAIKETNIITNEKSLCWTKRVRHKQQKSTACGNKKRPKDLKNANAIKKAIKQNHSTQNAKRSKRRPLSKCINCGIPHEPRHVQPMARAVQDMAEQIILSVCRKACK